MKDDGALLTQLKQLADLKLISDLDYFFARFLHNKSPDASDALLLAATLLSYQTGQGDVCISLQRFAEQPLFGSDFHPECQVIVAPSRAQWRESLQASPHVGEAGEQALMILDRSDRLYLSKYWQFESSLAMSLKARASQLVTVDRDLLKQGLARLFPCSGNDETDWQQVAAAMAVLKPFVVISGGPGTGKTTTVTKLLALLAEQSRELPLRIALAAPTGKAAARLSESIKEKKQQIDCDEQLRQIIPDEASTLHRLLGVIPGKVGFRHNRDNPLHLDLLVVDEASMIDLPLMARLLDALPRQARLILLGDKDQLASVEAGSVLGDICNAGLREGVSAEMADLLVLLTGEKVDVLKQQDSPLNDAVALLRKSYRFDAAGGIGVLAQAVNKGQLKQALASFDDLFNDNISLNTVDAKQLPLRLGQQGIAHYQHYLACESPIEALNAFNRFRILCALREGPYGVAQVNQHVEQALNQQRLIDSRQRFYTGRPIMITRNDYGVKLFNGDIGLIWPDVENGGRLRAFFIMPDGSVRKLLPNRLPQHETVYAMTVHKSQGSEFDQVLLILPDEASPVVSRELLYTGITRAKQQVAIWSHQTVFEQAIRRKMERSSGLQDALLGCTDV